LGLTAQFSRLAHDVEKRQYAHEQYGEKQANQAAKEILFS
jgi:hypothetical protein